MEDKNWKNVAIVLLVIAALALAWYILRPTPAAADTLRADSESSSEALAINESSSGAIAGSQIINNGQRPGVENTTYSEARIENAPSLGGLALGGGHPCAYSPATGQISIIGGGAGFGGMKVDSACMLMVMGAAGDRQAYAAAKYMLASRDPAACKAMEAMGMVQCGTPEAPKTSKSTKNSAAPAGGVAVGKCVMEGNKILFRATAGATAEQKAMQKEACVSSLGF